MYSLDRISAVTGLLIKHHLVNVITVTMQELIMRINVEVTAAKLLKDGTTFLVRGWNQPEIYWLCSKNWAEIRKISSIKFASFGTLVGSCGNFHEGSCHAHKSYNALEKNCVGQNSCKVTVSPENFGGDPCPNVLKKLSVEAICT
ncbi:unnamed protein product [Vicia faba]|uniref:beta-galactosidase n=1 Tax=Vicia faba TaxID=3906 RepID=A0AAV0YKK6_VICFA|nr:unnamed protein product [Vicia faba]